MYTAGLLGEAGSRASNRLRAKQAECDDGLVPRGIAQSGSAPALGAGGRGFKSLCPDQIRFPPVAVAMRLGTITAPVAQMGEPGKAKHCFVPASAQPGKAGLAGTPGKVIYRRWQVMNLRL